MSASSSYSKPAYLEPKVGRKKGKMSASKRPREEDAQTVSDEKQPKTRRVWLTKTACKDVPIDSPPTHLELKTHKTRCTERVRSELAGGYISRSAGEGRGKIMIQHTNLRAGSHVSYLVPRSRFIVDVAPIAYASDPQYENTLVWLKQAVWDPATPQGKQVTDLFAQWQADGLTANDNVYYDAPHSVITRVVRD